MDKLADGGFAFGSALLAVKIFRDNNLGGQERPGFGCFDIFLFENDFAVVVVDFRRAPLPLELVVGTDFGVAKHPFNGKVLAAAGTSPAAFSRHFGYPPMRFHRSNRQNFLTSFDHDYPFDEFPSAPTLTDLNDKTDR